MVDMYAALPNAELAIVPEPRTSSPRKPDLVNRIVVDFTIKDPVATVAPIRRAPNPRSVPAEEGWPWLSAARHSDAAGSWEGVRFTSEDHRATPFELFFLDLVYVFAMTQVTGYMAHERSAHGVLQGLLLLTLLWWTAVRLHLARNQARADEEYLGEAWPTRWRR